MKIVENIIDPPVNLLCIFIFLLLVILKKILCEKQFYPLLISGTLAFLVAEIACRFMNIGHTEAPLWEEQRVFRSETYAYLPNTELNYCYPDNPRGYFDEENKVIGTINNKGFRGLDKPFAKPDNITRIAILGDSFVLGIGVEDKDTLPANFERAIRSNYNNTEVLNFGWSGTSTDKQISLLERYVLSFDPDIVIIVLFLNDSDRKGTIKYLSGATFLAKARKYSLFLNAVTGTIEKYIGYKKMIRHYHDGYKEGSEGWEMMKNKMKKGKELSEKHDFQFVIALHPVLIQLNNNYSFGAIHKTIEKFCASLEVPFLDFFYSFYGKNASELWVHPTDQHSNEKANRISGEALSDFFEKKGLIEKKSVRPFDSSP